MPLIALGGGEGRREASSPCNIDRVRRCPEVQQPPETWNKQLAGDGEDPHNTAPRARARVCEWGCVNGGGDVAVWGAGGVAAEPLYRTQNETMECSVSNV